MGTGLPVLLVWGVKVLLVVVEVSLPLYYVLNLELLEMCWINPVNDGFELNKWHNNKNRTRERSTNRHHSTVWVQYLLKSVYLRVCANLEDNGQWSDPKGEVKPTASRAPEFCSNNREIEQGVCKQSTATLQYIILFDHLTHVEINPITLILQAPCSNHLNYWNHNKCESTRKWSWIMCALLKYPEGTATETTTSMTWGVLYKTVSPPGWFHSKRARLRDQQERMLRIYACQVSPVRRKKGWNTGRAP